MCVILAGVCRANDRERKKESREWRERVRKRERSVIEAAWLNREHEIVYLVKARKKYLLLTVEIGLIAHSINDNICTPKSFKFREKFINYREQKTFVVTF